MKMNKIISTFLAVLMLLGASTMLISAAQVATQDDGYTYNTGNGQTMMMATLDNANPYDYMGGSYHLPDGTEGTIVTEEDKLKTMDYRYGNDTYQLYVDAYSGEVALKNRRTGEILFTNPYNVGSSEADTSPNSTKAELLSQIIVHFYKNKDGEDKMQSYTSYWEAACREQVTVKSIKNGIRVEYSIGREGGKTLIPMQIAEEDIQNKIFKVIEEQIHWDEVEFDPYFGDPIIDRDHPYAEDQFMYAKLQSYYSIKNAQDPSLYPKVREQMLEDYPITAEFPIRVLVLTMAENEIEIKRLEAFVKRYCKDYTYEEKDADEKRAGYDPSKAEFPVFRMALEYTLDDKGLSVTMPANSIRFNETEYTLVDIEILPYMGAGMNPNQGYTFFPDGSGALFDFASIAAMGTEKEFTGKVYGEDYAYHEIKSKLLEVIRYPVFGLVEEIPVINYDYDNFGNQSNPTPSIQKRGFVAIVEEGASLMNLSSSHGGLSSEYNTVKMSVEPRPRDSYNMKDAISVGDDKPWTVVSSRKYTGNYTIRYLMLNDDSLAQRSGLESYYECSYVGMAKAYREYLESNGVLTRLTSEDVEENLPLYIETFGAFKSTKKILSVPVDVVSPLTSFKDITTMYDELSEEGISNINFIMKGYRKGGLTNETVPYNLKWDRAVSKEMDFDELLAYAREKGFGVYPDFDFVFSNTDNAFDGFSMKKHAAKTIDNRYTSKREYSATKHTYTSFFEMAISSASFSRFYEKLVPQYNKYEPMGIAVTTLGSYLNSDFDKKDPYNRADSEEFTVEAFAYIRENMPNAKVLTSGGNAYSWKYVDHITDIALDSSRIDFSTASVPFLGMVLHGYVELAGTSFNTEGNLDYAFLKTLESGAALKFLLSYQNTAALKEYENTSKYYSIRYNIWRDDVVSYYTQLNELLSGVQTSLIVDHKFVDGTRVADADEQAEDMREALQNALKAEEEKRLAEEEAKREKFLKLRLSIIEGIEEIKELARQLEASGDAKNPTIRDNFNTAKQTLLDAVETSNKKGATNNDKLTLNKVSGTWDAFALLANFNEGKMSYAYQLIDASERIKVIYAELYQTLNYLAAEPDFDPEKYADLESRLLNDTEITEIVASLGDVKSEVNTEVNAVYNKVLNGTWRSTSDKSKFNQTTYKFNVNAYVYVSDTNSNTGSSGTVGTTPEVNTTVSTSNRYEVTPYTIVYQEYENGTAFLMNFNDYRVTVEWNGRIYTLEAYGYIVLSKVA